MPTPSTPDALARYWAKRDFSVTSEPRGEKAAAGTSLSFVVQKHAATRLHYDFRLELNGVLLSWAVPKGPTLDPAVKRMAVHVEDHPLAYGSFEGTIPPGQYGAGTVIVWDNGTWESVGDPHEGIANGKLVFRLHGQKLEGLWELVKIAKPGDKQEAWILFKKRDQHARPTSDYDVLVALPDSIFAKPLKRPTETKPPEASGNSRARSANSIVPGAVKAQLPDKLAPQLATLTSEVPTSGHWLYEIKFDGYRIMARVDKGNATLMTRGGHDWSAKMPALVKEVESLGIGSAWLDGEIVVLGDDGTPNFNALQKFFDKHSTGADIEYFVFDLPYFEGYDLRAVELVNRRELLRALLDDKATEHIRISTAFETSPATLLASARRMNLEGLIAKRADASYVSRRTETWLKLKLKQRQEFVVAGYTDRSDGSTQVGSLLLGVYAEGGELVSAGSVGTGWDAAEAAALKRHLVKLEVEKSPFATGEARRRRWARRAVGTERWVQPKLVAEVEFAEWTPDGQIRHASYMALRSDKPARNIVRETAKVAEGASSIGSAEQATVSGIKVSHGKRVIDPSTGLTKLDLVRYYESIADWMLPHLKGRPCSLVRAPDGVTGSQFFQKHGERIGIPGITELPESLWPGHESLLEVTSAQALVGCAQMNVVELHTWNSTKKNINVPDRMVFDLDPGDGTPWGHVQEAAILIRALLKELDLEAWLKTSGGNGLHVVVPLTPKLDYETVKNSSEAIVRHLAKVIPSRFVATSGPANRAGKLYVDYLRNGFGATTAAAFSARARPGLGVSMPVAWDDVKKLKSGAHWTIASARDYVSFQKTDPWSDYWKKRQSLATAMKALD